MIPGILGSGLVGRRAISRRSPPLLVDAGVDSGEWVSGAQTLGATIEGGTPPYASTWTLQSGPSTAEISDDASLVPDVAPTLIGEYVFRITVEDALHVVAYDEVTLRWTPEVILGPLLFADYWAADRDDQDAINPRLVVNADPGGVDEWPEEAERNSVIGQFSDQPTWQPKTSATAFGGRPAVVFDGSLHALRAALGPTIASASRASLWVLGRWTGAPATATPRRMVDLAGGDSNDIVSLRFAGSPSLTYGFGTELVGTDDAVTSYANDTDPHLFEAALLASINNKFLRDGVTALGQGTGATAAEIVPLTLGDSAAGSRCGPCAIHRVILAHDPADPTAVPSAAQRANMRAMLSAYLPSLPAIKTLAVPGQSNAGAFVFGTLPANCSTYKDGPGGASIEEGPPGADLPYYWRTDDLYPACANLAAFLAAATSTPIAFFFHGEVATNENPNTHYGGDVSGLIDHVDVLSGRSDTQWILPLLNIHHLSGSSATLAVRAQQVALAAARPDRVTLINTDHLTPAIDGTHFSAAQYANDITPLVLAAAAAATGDASWVP